MITLEKAGMEDCREIHDMQVIAFGELLDKYRDVQTNPGAEPLEKIIRRMEQESTHYYFIALDGKRIGAIRIATPGDSRAKIAPMFILPAFQGNGYAQQAISLAEVLYPDAVLWELDTIKQESKLCHLYEKMGYIPTGKEEEIQEGMTLIFYKKHIHR